MYPKARPEEDLIITELADELVVYDRKDDQGHTMNQTAAFVWRHCDGETSPAQLAAKLADQFGLPADEDIVWMTLNELEQANLLQTPLVRSQNSKAVSRRDFLRMAQAAGLAIGLIPVIKSIVIPAPAAAASPGGQTTPPPTTTAPPPTTPAPTTPPPTTTTTQAPTTTTTQAPTTTTTQAPTTTTTQAPTTTTTTPITPPPG